MKTHTFKIGDVVAAEPLDGLPVSVVNQPNKFDHVQLRRFDRPLQPD